MLCLSRGSAWYLFCLIKFKSFLKTISLSSLIMLFWLSRKMYLFCTEVKSDKRVLEALCKYASSPNPASSALSAWVSRTAVKSFHVGPRSSCNENQILNSYLFLFLFPTPTSYTYALTDKLYVVFLAVIQFMLSELLKFLGFFTFPRYWHPLAVEICGHAVLAVLCFLTTDVNRITPVKKCLCKWGKMVV